jgi:hypothetical protein
MELLCLSYYEEVQDGRVIGIRVNHTQCIDISTAPKFVRGIIGKTHGAVAENITDHVIANEKRLMMQFNTLYKERVAALRAAHQ